MVAATLLWGATFVVIRDSLARFDPVGLVGARFAVAAALLALLLAARRRAPTRAEWITGALSGLCAAFAFVFQAIGLTTTSAGSSAFLTCAGTMLSGFFAWALLGQRPGPVLLAGLATGLAGSALLSPGGVGALGPGEWWTLIGASLFALQIVVVARGVAGADVVAITAVQAATVAVVMLPFARDLPARFAALDPATWLRFGYLAIAGSLVAPLLQIHAQRVLPAGRIGLLFALEPVFALLFAVGWGGERFTVRWLAGAALILAAVIAVESRSLATSRRARS
jgi:drug/metabolite transporter (DMT)-like permease